MLLPILLIAFLAMLASVETIAVQMNAGCGFHLSTSGGFNGSVGQLANGQVRAGSDLTPSLFTWFGDAFADQQGRSCWWTRMVLLLTPICFFHRLANPTPRILAPTSVLQCDWNQEPSHGFEVGCYGGVSYRDQSLFYECYTGDGDEVNLYLQPKGINCSTIMLHADACRPPCAGESSSSSLSTDTTMYQPHTTSTSLRTSTSSARHSSAQVTTTTTSSPASGSTYTPGPGRCDVAIAESPDEIILIDKQSPDTAYGLNSDMSVKLSPDSSAIFVFRLTALDAGKECALVFNLPPVTQQQPPWYTLTGSGQVRFALLDMSPANPANTTYSNAPGVAMPLEAAVLTPGMTLKPLTFPCPGENVDIAIMMKDDPGSDAHLEYNQLEPELPLGLYLVIVGYCYALLLEPTTASAGNESRWYQDIAFEFLTSRYSGPLYTQKVPECFTDEVLSTLPKLSPSEKWSAGDAPVDRLVHQLPSRAKRELRIHRQHVMGLVARVCLSSHGKSGTTGL
ncbi:hypothetical protein M434DRAFT_29350 [Hypoxylon sp. CO27-5]|nr:hypothetical protein M434DRAFT_29350 [Hypoxylon sp. CO27-5]